MRNILISSLAVVLLFAITGCQHSGGGGAMSPTTPAAMMYTCPMHPEVVSDHPGKCPKCGMDLVPKN